MTIRVEETNTKLDLIVSHNLAVGDWDVAIPPAVMDFVAKDGKLATPEGTLRVLPHPKKGGQPYDNR